MDVFVRVEGRWSKRVRNKRRTATSVLFAWMDRHDCDLSIDLLDSLNCDF